MAASEQDSTEAFIYLGVRLFYPVAPPDDLSPEALTMSKAEAIVARQGDRLALAFDATPFPSTAFDPSSYRPYARGEAKLDRADLAGVCTPAVPNADGLLTLSFKTDDVSLLQALVDRRDPDLTHTTAFERRLMHWGTQNWGGLTLSLVHGVSTLLRCDLDVFAPEEVPGARPCPLFISAVSVDPQVEPAKPAVKSVDGVTDVSQDVPRDSTHVTPEGDVSQVGVEENLVTIARCTECGGRFTVKESFLKALSSSGPNLIVAACNGCGRGASIRQLEPAERQRAGVSYEVLDSERILSELPQPRRAQIAAAWEAAKRDKSDLSD